MNRRRPLRRSRPEGRARFLGRPGEPTCAARSPHCIVATLVAGCMVGPDYQRPDVDSPKAFIYEAKDAADTANTSGGSSSTIRCSTS